MITRRHRGDGVESTATWSGCGAYRYELARVWGAGPKLLFLMLNPSTADECRNDPTVARCEARARQTGFGAFGVVNLFAFSATDPRALRQVADPVGPRNDAVLLRATADAGLVICAWGNHGRLNGRADQVLAMLKAGGRPLHHLGLTKSGQPAHPLYIPMSRQPAFWDQAAISAMSATSMPAPPVTTPMA